MERLKPTSPENPATRPETDGATPGDNGTGCPPSALEVLEQELVRAQSELGLGEPTAVVGAPPPLPEVAEPMPLPRGTSVGRYLVLERLGAGGMGEVYAAFDPQLNRRVAIKLLLPGGEGQDRSQARLRLMREAQSMARLSHPHVLPVYDIGEHGDQVFIALELVEGQTLRQWLKEQRRGWREVVHVLTQAGRGLVAAHAVGLVHRDFKPDNVLVGRDGRVLVFDFGLACEQGTGIPGAPLPVDLFRILHGDLPGETSSGAEGGVDSGLSTRDPIETPVTRAGLIMGTPGYMAPEQYRQEPLTGRADQFSFCATLYYALYGEHAFEGVGAAALARATLEGRLRPAPRDSDVPAWLRRVVLQGLRFQPHERHASLERLIEALHDDPRTRYSRQVMVAVAAAFLVAVTAGAVGQWHQRQGLCQGVSARMEGVWDASRAQAVQRAFLTTGQPYATDAWQGVHEALDTYAAGWVEHQTHACAATRLHAQASEEVLAARTACLERRRSEVKALTDVLAEADAAVLEHAVEAVRGLSPLESCDGVASRAPHVKAPTGELAAQVEGLHASLARARALRISGQSTAGLTVATSVAAQARALGYRPLEAEALLEWGQQQQEARDPGAEATLREAVWTADEVGQDDVRAEALVALTQLVAYDGARVADGHAWYHQARALLTRTDRQGRLLAELESAHGLVSAAGGDAPAAEASQRGALAALDDVSPSDSPEVAVVLRRLGNALSAQGRHEEALTVYRRAYEAFRHALGAEHPRVGSTLVNIGTSLDALGRPAEALVPLRQGVDVVERTLPPRHPFRAVALDALGAALAHHGQRDEALPALWRAVEAAERARGPEHPDVAVPCVTLGEVLLDMGRPREAGEYFDRALLVREQAWGPLHPELAAPLTGQGEVLLALGRAAEALVPLERALALRASESVASEAWAQTRFALARALWESRQDEARARRLAQEAEGALGHPGAEALRERIQTWRQAHAPRG